MGKIIKTAHAVTLEYPENTNLPGEGEDSNLLVGVFENIMKWLTLILAVIAVIAFLISGIIYITSAGNEERMELAKRGLIYSVIGLAIALLAWIIILTIDKLLGGGST